jgi:hypothetical protein
MHETLYSPRVADAPLRMQLKDVNVSLGMVVRCTQRPALREAVVCAILRETACALEHALLQGGPQRHFTPADVPQVREDVTLLKDFFLARDSSGVPQGVPIHRADEACRPLHRMLVLLATPSELLVRMWETSAVSDATASDADPSYAALVDSSAPPAAFAPSGGGCDEVDAPLGGRAGGAGDPESVNLSNRQRIAYVLAQRTDDAARKWAVAARQHETAAGSPSTPAAPAESPGLRAKLSSFLKP